MRKRCLRALEGVADPRARRPSLFSHTPPLGCKHADAPQPGPRRPRHACRRRHKGRRQGVCNRQTEHMTPVTSRLRTPCAVILRPDSRSGPCCMSLDGHRCRLCGQSARIWFRWPRRPSLVAESGGAARLADGLKCQKYHEHRICSTSDAPTGRDCEASSNTIPQLGQRNCRPHAHAHTMQRTSARKPRWSKSFMSSSTRERRPAGLTTFAFLMLASPAKRFCTKMSSTLSASASPLRSVTSAAISSANRDGLGLAQDTSYGPRRPYGFGVHPSIAWFRPGPSESAMTWAFVDRTTCAINSQTPFSTMLGCAVRLS